MTRLTFPFAATGILLASVAMAQDEAPLVISAHVSDDFMPGFPESFQQLDRTLLDNEPSLAHIIAVYGQEGDDRIVEAFLYPKSSDGMQTHYDSATGLAERGGQEASIREQDSPEGLPMRCMTGPFQGYSTTACVTDFRGFVMQTTVRDQLGDDAATPPDAVVTAAIDSAGLFSDAVNAAPDASDDSEAAPTVETAEPAPTSQPTRRQTNPDYMNIAPNETAFAKALPETIGDLSLKTTGVEGPEIVYKATYRNDPDVAMQIKMVPFDFGSSPVKIDMNPDRFASLGVKNAESDFTTPGGTDVRCLHLVGQRRIGSNFCTTAIPPGLLDFEAVFLLEEGQNEVPQQVIDGTHQMIGELVDRLATIE